MSVKYYVPTTEEMINIVNKLINMFEALATVFYDLNYEGWMEENGAQFEFKEEKAYLKCGWPSPPGVPVTQ